MSPRSQALKCPNFVTSNWLFVILLSPLPHSPGYLVKHTVNHLAGNRADYTPSYPVRNPAGCLDDYPASYWAGYLPENLVSYSVDYPDGNSAGYSAHCPGSSPESNPESDWADNPPDYLENYPADSLPGCLGSYLGDFRSRSACRAATYGRLLQLDNLGTDTGPPPLRLALPADPVPHIEIHIVELSGEVLGQSQTIAVEAPYP